MKKVILNQKSNLLYDEVVSFKKAFDKLKAKNYEFTYVNGTLTVTNATGINTPTLPEDNGQLFDLQGRKIKTPRRGVFIKDRKKVVM